MGLLEDIIAQANNIKSAGGGTSYDRIMAKAQEISAGVNETPVVQPQPTAPAAPTTNIASAYGNAQRKADRETNKIVSPMLQQAKSMTAEERNARYNELNKEYKRLKNAPPNGGTQEQFADWYDRLTQLSTEMKVLKNPLSAKEDLELSAASTFGAFPALLENISDTILGGGANLLADAITEGKALLSATIPGVSADSKAADWLKQQAEKVYTTDGLLGAGTWSDRTQQKYDERITDTRRAIDSLAGSGVQMVGSLALGNLAGAAAGAGSAANTLTGASNAARAAQITQGASKAALGMGASGSSTRQALSEGAEIGDAIAYGQISGLMETAIESVAGGVPGMGRGKLGEAVDAVMDLANRSGFLSAVIDLVGEGAEEAVSAFLQPYAQRMYYNPEAKNATLGELSEAFVSGVALSAIMQGAAAGANALTSSGGTTQTFMPYTEQEAAAIRKDANTFRNVVAGVDTSVSAFFNKWRSGRKSHLGEKFEKLYVGKLSPDSALAIGEILGYEVGARDVIFTNDDTKHVADEHPDLPDWALDAIPEVIAAPDSILKGHEGTGRNAGKTGVLMQKMFPDGNVVTVEFDNPGRGTMQVTTVYTTKKAKAAPSMVTAAETTDTRTPKATEPATSAVTTVTQPDPTVNTNNLPEGTGAASSGFAYRALQEDPDVPMHEAGENPARPVNMPAIDVEGRNTSATARTAMEAQVTPDAMVPTIENLVAAGEFSYDPTTNDQVLEKARSTIEKDGFALSLSKWKKAIEKRASAETTALGWELYNAAASAGDGKLAIEILGDMVIYQRGNAQALQAQRILKKLTPEGQLYHMQRTAQSLAEEYAGKKGVDIKINEQLATDFLAAKTAEERNAIIGQIQQDIADQIPSTFMDKFTALRYINMLGNFKTQLRNVSSNAIMKAVSTIRYEAAAALEQLASKASGGKFERTKSLRVGKEWMNAAKQDFGNVRDTVLGDAKFGETNIADSFARGIENRRTIFKNSGTWGTNEDSSALAKGVRKTTDALWKVPEAYRSATNWAMESGDILFSKSAYARSLAGWLKARGFTPQQFLNGEIDAATMDSARAYAVKEAQEATFRDNNAFSTWFSRLGRRSGTPKLVKVISEGAVPFRKTPANILLRAVEYSPANIIDTAIIKPIQAKQGKVTGNDIINSAAKTLTGTGLFLLGMALRGAGMLRGGSSEEERDANNLLGLQDYSLEIPGYGTYTFDWAAPSALTMFTGAQLQDLLDDGELTWADMEDALMSLTDPMLEMSMLSGVDNALSNVKYSDYSLLQMAGTMALSYLTQGLTNTMVGQIEKTTEENRMTTYVDKESALPEWVQREVGKASTKIPGWDYQQTEYQDELGRAESSGSVAGRIFENIFSPGYFEPVNKDKVANWAVDLQEELKANKVDGNVLPSADVSTTVNQTPMTQSEKETYKSVYGEAYSDVYSALIDSEAFKNLTLAQQSQVAGEVKEFATDQAKREVANSRGEDFESNWDKRADMPANVLADVCIYGAALSSVDKDAGKVSPESYTAMDALLEDYDDISAEAQSAMEEKPLFFRLLEAHDAGINSEQFMNSYNSVKALGEDASFADKAGKILNDAALNDNQKWHMLYDIKGGASGNKDKVNTAKAAGVPIALFVDAAARLDGVSKSDDVIAVLNSMGASNSEKSKLYALYTTTKKSGGKNPFGNDYSDTIHWKYVP